MVFVDLFRAWGGLTAAAVTFDTVADESRKMMDGVTRPRLGFVAKTGIFVTMETP